jgi:hypothetical protein
VAWPTALVGLGLFVFAAVALTGPGRIDIIDAQTRYEVGRSLVDHGDVAIHNPEVAFTVFPGRDGQQHTYYRLPQSVVAAGCVLVADATGPISEARRHFFFSLHGAVVAAGLAVAYAVWFRRRGLSPAAAVGWAAAGIFCTPNWYYSTSCFDEILGAWVCVAALVMAHRAGTGGGLGRCAVAGLLVGLAINCKPPLGLFLLPVAAAADVPTAPLRSRLTRLAVILAGVGVGVAAYVGYDKYKFPGDIKASHAELVASYPPFFFGNPAEALLDLTAGPASGTVWYAPAALLGLFGAMRRTREGEVRTVAALGLAALGFVGFICLMTFYKGDVAWGPRYLTPFFAAFWLYAPDGAKVIARRWTALLLTAGAVVQVLGLSADPHRLYLERKVPADFYLVDPWLYFQTDLSHLFNRPREIYDIATSPPAPEFNPAPVPTFAAVLDVPLEPDEVPKFMHRYQVLHGSRFWWASLPHLPADRRPVDLAQTGLVFGGTLACGLAVLVAGLTGDRRLPTPS